MCLSEEFRENFAYLYIYFLRILISFDLVSEGKYFGFLHLQSTYIRFRIFKLKLMKVLESIHFKFPILTLLFAVSAIISLIYKCKTFLLIIISTNNEIRT